MKLDTQFEQLLEDIDRRYDEFNKLISKSSILKDNFKNFYKRKCPWNRLPEEEKDMKYYIVIAKCGHVGRRHYIPVAFGVCANSGKDAAARARFLPRVKHNFKDAILFVKEVDKGTYLKRRTINFYDLYLNIEDNTENKIVEHFLYPRLFDEPNVIQDDTEDEEKINLKKIKKAMHNNKRKGKYIVKMTKTNIHEYSKKDKHNDDNLASKYFDYYEFD